MADLPFTSRHAVVTGGGAGLGRATALALAERGAASVIVTGRREEPLRAVADLHPAIRPVVADVRDEAGAAAVVAAVTAGSGRLDVVVHNAGVWRSTPVDGLDDTAVREVVDTNVVGPLTLTPRLLPLLNEGASIVFVSSVMGHLPGPGQAVYSASKAAVDSLTRSWASELAPRRIRVNAVAPGSVETEGLIATARAAGWSDEKIEAVRASKARTFPLGRYGTPDDVTAWITHLAATTSSWVTGQVITVDGGWDLLSGPAV
ncbi:SDR family NAD(P)-dependent oxidoreductase [Streptomyces sp. NPDC050560]|uniref:SDR family NAD(P)-dependent oxidoreductase n=1 Tax=Streptomyces sp. NPDC050560 TaxID=3365630 RepID=UPI00378B0435